MPKSNTKQSVTITGYVDAVVEQEEECVKLSISESVFARNAEMTSVDLYPNEVDDLIVALESAKEDAIAFENEDTDEVSVRPATPRPIRLGDNVPQIVQGYIDAKVPIVLDYTDEIGQRTTRTISPREIAQVHDLSGFTPPQYVRAWDHEADDYRSFRLTRINGLAPSVEEYVSE